MARPRLFTMRECGEDAAAIAVEALRLSMAVEPSSEVAE
jgi:hypothetical protein